MMMYGARMPYNRLSFRRLLIAATLASCAVLVFSSSASAGTIGINPPIGSSIVTDLNHVTAVTTKAKGQKLYNALLKLKLPSAWSFASYSAISSGGVRLGNVNIELGAGTSPEAGSQFVTFEPPTLTGLTAALDERGIKHGAPDPQMVGPKLLYTLVELPGFAQANKLTAQFCAYNFTVPIPRVAPANNAGLVSVSRVRINAKDPASWSKLFAPAKPSAGYVYRLPSGPVVQLIRSSSNSVASVDVAVKNVATAAKAFRAVGIPVKSNVALVGSLKLRLLKAY